MDSKCSWTNEETLEFAGFMKELIIEGLRADAGQFKPGAFNKLAAKMIEKWPACGINASHCKNKHKRLKEKYQSAADMLACSGFGWSDEKKCVEVDSKQVLEAYLKACQAFAHLNRKYTPGKSFPLFPRLEAIFGKDRANGNFAMSGNDAKEQLQVDDEQSIGGEEPVMFETTAEESDSPFNAYPSIASSSERIRVKNAQSFKKGKDADVIKYLVDTVRYAVKQQGQHVQIMAKVISGVNDEVNLGRTLKNLGLFEDEVVMVAIKFTQNPQWEKTFWNLMDD